MSFITVTPAEAKAIMADYDGPGLYHTADGTIVDKDGNAVPGEPPLTADELKQLEEMRAARAAL